MEPPILLSAIIILMLVQDHKSDIQWHSARGSQALWQDEASQEGWKSNRCTFSCHCNGPRLHWWERNGRYCIYFPQEQDAWPAPCPLPDVNSKPFLLSFLNFREAAQLPRRPRPLTRILDISLRVPRLQNYLSGYRNCPVRSSKQQSTRLCSVQLEQLVQPINDFAGRLLHQSSTHFET